MQVLLNGQPVTSYVTPDQINFQVPSNSVTGPVSVTLSGLAAPPAPVLVQIDKPAPVIAVVNTAAGAPVVVPPSFPRATRCNVLAAEMDPTIATSYQGRLRVTVAGFAMDIQQVTALASGVSDIQVVLNQSFGASQVPLAVVADGSASQATAITVK